MNGAPSPAVAALVLAAGGSRRMGGPHKLLAEIDARPLVARVADAALASRAGRVLVVVGCEGRRVERALAGRRLEIVANPAWESGLASSLARGLGALGADVSGVLVCLADMPWVEASHLDALIEAFAAESPPPVCVPVHGGRRGNPVLWPARHFGALAALEGDVGGRALLGQHAAEVREVAMPDAAVLRDVDRPEDLPPGG